MRRLHQLPGCLRGLTALRSCDTRVMGSAGMQATCWPQDWPHSPSVTATPSSHAKATSLPMQAYNVRDARDLYDSNTVQGLPVLDWGTLAKAPPIDRTLSPLRPYYQCCGLKPGHNMIDFAEDCGWDNFMAPNYTDPAMPFAAPVADNATQLRIQNTTEALGAEAAEAQPGAAVSLRRWRKQQAGQAKMQT